MKICSKCNIEKTKKEFSRRKKSKDGLMVWCKVCSKEYRLLNRVKAIEYGNKWYQDHKSIQLERGKKYYKDNKQDVLLYKKSCYSKTNLQRKERYKKDINFKLSLTIRNRLNDVINGNCKAGSAVRDLGCSIEELKIYLELKFLPGMTWDNWGTHGWHIDHIKPLSKFDLTDRKQFLEACNYTNLQPLWWQDNLEKRNKTQ